MTVTEDRLALEGTAAPRAPEPQRSVRVALFGLGRTGLRHAVVLSTIANVELVAIGDPDGHLRSNARGMGLPGRPYPRLDTMLRRAEAEALVIAHPLDAVPGLYDAAMASGAALLIDAEPMMSVAGLEPLAAAARQGRAIGCAVPLAHHPVFQHALGLIESKVLGAVREVRAAR